MVTSPNEIAPFQIVFMAAPGAGDGPPSYNRPTSTMYARSLVMYRFVLWSTWPAPRRRRRPAGPDRLPNRLDQLTAREGAYSRAQPCTPTPVPLAAPGEEVGRGLAADGWPPRAARVEPGQALLAGGPADQAGPARLLLERRAAAAPPPARPAADHAADARRHPRRGVLREAGAGPRAGLAADRSGARRRRQGQPHGHGPGPGQPDLRRQPRLHRAAPAAQPRRLAAPAGARPVRPRPLRAVHLRRRPHGRQAGQGGAGRAGPARLREDLRRHRHAGLRAAGADPLLRGRTRLRRAG